jgi:hypothetical protein
MACSEPAGECTHYDDLPDELPAVKQLSASDWYQVLSVALKEGRYVFEGCMNLPGMQQLDAQQVGELLRVCVDKQDWNGEVCGLLNLPGAQLMSAATIGDLLRQFLQAVPADAAIDYEGQAASSWVTLLCLPHAAEMPNEVAQQLHDTAVEGGLACLAKAILGALPQQAEAVCAVTGERLVRGILAAIKRVPHGGDLLLWDEQPGLQSLDAGSCVQLIESLLQLAGRIDVWSSGSSYYTYNYDRIQEEVPAQLLGLVHALLQEPACQRMQWPVVLGIFKACLRPACSTDCIPIIERVASAACQNGIGHIVQSCTERNCHAYCALLVVFAVTALPAAADIDHEQLLELLSEACQAFPSACVWRQLMQLPAAQQMLPAELAAVLSKVVDGSCAEDMSRLAQFDVSEVAGVLLHHPVAQQLDGGDVAALLERVAQQTHRCGLLAVAGQLLSHPASVSMTCDATCRLLGLFVGIEGVYSTVLRLLQLPAAQELSSPQIKLLLWVAFQNGYKRVCEALGALPAGAAARDDPEVQVVLGDDGGVWEEPSGEGGGHVERGWCSCPRCSQL